MANDNHIKNYTAADIEKYHGGQLSPKDMHDLEKAAMDDPFLADALEGYASAGVNAAADIIQLKKNLADRMEGAKIIPLHKERRNSFRMLRAAAVIIFVVGAGLLVYQFAFNNTSDEIAQAETQKKETVRATDSSVTSTAPVTNPVSTLTGDQPITKPDQPAEETKINTDDKGVATVTTIPKTITGETIVNDRETAGVTITKTATTPPVISAPSGGRDIQTQNAIKEGDKKDKNKDLAKETEAKEKASGYAEVGLDKDGQKRQARQTEDQQRAVAASRKADEQYYRNQASNTFRGRVTDVSDVGVPFANVTNVQDNAGTYTDAYGNFILTSPDSILTVNIRSIGFENNNSQLRNDVTNNKVVLQDDRRSLSEVVLSNQKTNTVARAKNANVKMEEPEPADGWDNYDAYLVNNLNVPEEYKTKQTNSSSVEVSFEVDKNGEPVNIKIVKSLCATCDKEAIRLVKDGPKWKRKAKKGRTTVTIPFYTSF